MQSAKCSATGRGTVALSLSDNSEFSLSEQRCARAEVRFRFDVTAKPL
jgi:hypothetical protein